MSRMTYGKYNKFMLRLLAISVVSHGVAYIPGIGGMTVSGLIIMGTCYSWVRGIPYYKGGVY